MNLVSQRYSLNVGQSYTIIMYMDYDHIKFPEEEFFIVNEERLSDIYDGDTFPFGICFVSPLICNYTGTYGITCQIAEEFEDGSGNFVIRLRGLQRFVVDCDASSWIMRDPINVYICVGEILPEIKLPEPLKSINMGSINRFRDCSYLNHIFKLYEAATTPWPAHFYDYKYNIQAILKRVQPKLPDDLVATMPQDPSHASFWLARNLYLTVDVLISVFIANSAYTRLKLILKALD